MPWPWQMQIFRHGGILGGLVEKGQLVWGRASRVESVEDGAEAAPPSSAGRDAQRIEGNHDALWGGHRRRRMLPWTGLEGGSRAGALRLACLGLSVRTLAFRRRFPGVGLSLGGRLFFRRNPG